ncbi:hypothetical protein FHS59_001971 [Algoriphagus iocasae]|uniref:Uncharacterized protein n=1 Tax=Algoriphagus iocasae TaxID=1836499 RepID=A0A841MHL4_9BACT|nr:hypothetical protein [Algoriphagus iocasae]
MKNGNKIILGLILYGFLKEEGWVRLKKKQTLPIYD